MMTNKRCTIIEQIRGNLNFHLPGVTNKILINVCMFTIQIKCSKVK